jgi:hypothetical protein
MGVCSRELVAASLQLADSGHVANLRPQFGPPALLSSPEPPADIYFLKIFRFR